MMSSLRSCASHTGRTPERGPEVRDLPEVPDLRFWFERRPLPATVLRLVALAVIVTTLGPDRRPAGIALIAVAAAGWIVWSVSVPENNWPATVGTIVFGFAGALLIGIGQFQTPGVIFIWTSAMYLGSYHRSRLVTAAWSAILATALITGAVSKHGMSIPTVVGMVAGAWAVGYARRARILRVRQTEELLAQTRRANAEEAQAATLAERARIARDIHDVLAHSLSGLAIQLEAADALLTDGRDPERAHAMVVRAQRTARDGLAECRRAVAALREDVRPLTQSLTELVDSYRADSGAEADFVTDFTAESLPQLSVESTQALLRVVQEALTNIRKHAFGAVVTVRLTADADASADASTDTDASADADTVTVTIDNSASVQSERPLAASGGGYGLLGLRERLDLLGGTLSAGPGPDGVGWRVSAAVPVQRLD